MKLTRDDNSSIQRIERYAPGQISVNGVTYSQAIIVSPESVAEWECCDISSLNEEHIDVALGFKPEILLLGSGARQRFPSANFLSDLARRGMGIEVMDSAAACRTYNLLASEQRRVVAALLPIELE